MRRFRKPALGTLAALAVLFAAVPLSARMRVANQRIDSQFDPEEDSRHPAELALAMVLNEEHPNGAGVCVSYSHDRSTRPDRGRVAIAMRVFRSDRPSRLPVEVLALDFGRMKIESGRAADCKTLEEPLTNAAFGRLAGYIFGNNRSKRKIAMTAPVLQERERPTSEKIAMTGPVLMEDVGESWLTFVLPEGYTLDNAPEPIDPAVEVTTMPARTVATLRFSGRLREESIERHTEKLERWIADNDYRAVSPPRAAGYNPPWTLPPLRRNEILIDVEPAS